MRPYTLYDCRAEVACRILVPYLLEDDICPVPATRVPTEHSKLHGTVEVEFRYKGPSSGAM